MAEKKRRVLPLGGRNLRGLGLCLGLFLLWICLLLPLGRDILDRNRQNGAMRNRIRQLAVFASGVRKSLGKKKDGWTGMPGKTDSRARKPGQGVWRRKPPGPDSRYSGWHL